MHSKLHTNDTIARIAVMPSVFDADVCARIRALVEDRPPAQGKVGTAVADNPRMRRSDIWVLPPNEDTAFIFEPIRDVVLRLNQGYGFELQGFAEGCQIARYRDGEAGHYDWHIDLGTGVASRRKLSCSVQLSAASDYEGGDLDFHLSGLNRESIRAQGTLVAFPSYLEHRVAPVTRGTRFSLVVWVEGPPYR